MQYKYLIVLLIDDLKKTCQINRKAREREWPKAQRILEEETAQFMADLHHRATGPTIQRLKAQANQLKDEEVTRLLKKLNNTDQQSHEEIQRSFDRLIKKLLHPPLESLRDEARKGTPHGLLDALKNMQQLLTDYCYFRRSNFDPSLPRKCH